MSVPNSRPAGGPPPRERAINLPPSVLALIGANVAVHILMAVIPDEAWRWVMVNLSFIPIRYSVEGLGGWPALAGPFTYQFLHGSWLHLILNMVMLAAFSSPLVRTVGAPLMLLIYTVGGIVGAFAHFAIYPDANAPVIGASGSVSALFGAALLLMAQPDRFGRRALRFWPAALIWIGLSVMIGFTGMPGIAEGPGQIAWAAHVGGFLAGIALMGVLIAAARRRRS